MSAKVYSRGIFLGETIQEKTRSLLGWNDQNVPSTMNDAALNRKASSGMLSASRRHPYAMPTAARIRKNSSSSSSTCSEYSEPSPSYSVRSDQESLSPDPFFVDCNSPYAVPAPNPAFRSAEREARVFERLRQLVPVLPTDRNAYQILIDTVSQVMELEQQLEELKEQTEDAKNNLRLAETYSEFDNCVFPDDLESVDVTAFKHLLDSDMCGQNIPDFESYTS